MSAVRFKHMAFESLKIEMKRIAAHIGRKFSDRVNKSSQPMTPNKLPIANHLPTKRSVKDRRNKQFIYHISHLFDALTDKKGTNRRINQ